MPWIQRMIAQWRWRKIRRGLPKTRRGLVEEGEFIDPESFVAIKIMVSDTYVKIRTGGVDFWFHQPTGGACDGIGKGVI